MKFSKLFGRGKKETEKTASAPAKEEIPEDKKDIGETFIETEAPVKEQTVSAKPEAERPTAEASAEKSVSGKVSVRVGYNRSFEAKLIQSDEKLKNYYGEIKNCLLSYGVRPRMSWQYETFKTGRNLLVKLAMRGKTLGVYLALEPEAYAGTKYKIDDVSAVFKNSAVPVLYKLKNDRRVKYCKELIAAVMEKFGLGAKEISREDYALKYPYEELEPLIERGLVKLTKLKGASENGVIEVSRERFEEIAAADGAYPEVVESISVSEAEEKLADDTAEKFVEESGRLSDRTKKDIVNIDALGKYFSAGECVTIEEIRKRVPSVSKKATYVKVLARGILDKALNVEADDFSPTAIKMIVLTGGTVKRTKKN